ncbi:MAG: TonB-dependent receptor [bacterium]|nr:TonB-dependent receptor [bacterium]
MRGLISKGRVGLIVFALAGLAMIPIQGEAQSLTDRVSINGYGTWVYGKTDDNHYLNAGPDGEYEHSFAALTFIGKASEDVTVFIQPNFEYAHEEFEVELAFAFADWEISDSFHLRAGRVRHPFGIYTEIFDVGTLRPFLDLPQGIYGAKFVARSYSGLGINGRTFGDRGWGLEYDLYGGQIDQKSHVPGIAAPVQESLRDTLGGRLTLTAPVDGLRFGVSGYSGTQKESEDIETSGKGGTQTVYGLFGEYLGNGFSVRGEYAKFDDPDSKIDAAYFEVGYMFTKNWQVAGRWDWYDGESELLGGIKMFDPLLEHQDLAFALNYWVNPKMVFKLEYHKVQGNRFAGSDEDVIAVIMRGELIESTDVIQLGVNFSF